MEVCAAPHASPRARWTPVLYVLRVPSAKLRPVWSLATHLRVERIECKPPRALRKSRRFSYGSPSRRAGVLFFPSLLLLCTGSLYSEHTHFRIRRLLTRTFFLLSRAASVNPGAARVFSAKERSKSTFQGVLLGARPGTRHKQSSWIWPASSIGTPAHGLRPTKRPEERTRTGVKTAGEI